MYNINASHIFVRAAKFTANRTRSARAALFSLWIDHLPVSLDPSQLVAALVAAMFMHLWRTLRHRLAASKPQPIKVAARGKGAHNPVKEVMLT
jgi:hypothetical protein